MITTTKHDQEVGVSATTMSNQRECVVGYNVPIPVAKDIVDYKVPRAGAKHYGTSEQNVFLPQNIR